MAENKKFSFNLPSPYQADLSKIADQQRMAAMLQAQSQEPIERFSYKGIEANIPFTAGLAKALQGFGGAYLQKQAREQEKALSEKYSADQKEDFSNFIKMLNAPAVVGSPAFPAIPAVPETQDHEGFPQPGSSALPAVEAVVARQAGQIDPEMIGKFKTQEMQQMAMTQLLAQRQAQIEAERRANEPYNLNEGQKRFQPVPGGEPRVIASGTPKTNISPIDVSKFTSESVKSARRTDGTLDINLLIPIPPPRPSSLAVYDEYVKQAKAAGRVPKSIEQFETDQKIAGRQPAAPRDRVVYDPERGGVVNLDTGAFTPAMQGSKPIGPAPSPGVKKEIMNIQQQRSTMQGAINAVQESPLAFSFKRGLGTNLGSYTESIAGRSDTKKEAQARAYVFNNVSAVIKERAGTATSVAELARINAFMPAVTDNADQIINKLKGYQEYLDHLAAGTLGNPTQPTTATNQTPIYANKPGKPRIMSTDGGNTWKEVKE